MGDFISNPATTIPGPKSAEVTLTPGKDPNKRIRAIDYNALRSALLDCRDAIRSAAAGLALRALSVMVPMGDGSDGVEVFAGEFGGNRGLRVKSINHDEIARIHAEGETGAYAEARTPDGYVRIGRQFGGPSYVETDDRFSVYRGVTLVGYFGPRGLVVEPAPNPGEPGPDYGCRVFVGRTGQDPGGFLTSGVSVHEVEGSDCANIVGFGKVTTEGGNYGRAALYGTGDGAHLELGSHGPVPGPGVDAKSNTTGAHVGLTERTGSRSPFDVSTDADGKTTTLSLRGGDPSGDTTDFTELQATLAPYGIALVLSRADGASISIGSHRLSVNHPTRGEIIQIDFDGDGNPYFQAASLDGTMYRLTPPNGGGAANWVAAP